MLQQCHKLLLGEPSSSRITKWKKPLLLRIEKPLRLQLLQLLRKCAGRPRRLGGVEDISIQALLRKISIRKRKVCELSMRIINENILVFRFFCCVESSKSILNFIF